MTHRPDDLLLVLGVRGAQVGARPVLGEQFGRQDGVGEQVPYDRGEGGEAVGRATLSDTADGTAVLDRALPGGS